MVYWLCLTGAIALEIAGTVSMKMSRGFTVLLPSILLFVFYACSFAMMTIAVRRIDMSVSYAIWSADAAYPGGQKVVWHHEVYQAKWWTQGDVPDGTVAPGTAVPWQLIGPVLPGETPAPQPTVPPGTFPAWNDGSTYTAGMRVMLNGVGYQAKWWTQGDDPSHQTGDPSHPSPWTPLTPQQVAALADDATPAAG